MCHNSGLFDFSSVFVFWLFYCLFLFNLSQLIHLYSVLCSCILFGHFLIFLSFPCLSPLHFLSCSLAYLFSLLAQLQPISNYPPVLCQEIKLLIIFIQQVWCSIQIFCWNQLLEFSAIVYIWIYCIWLFCCRIMTHTSYEWHKSNIKCDMTIMMFTLQTL